MPRFVSKGVEHFEQALPAPDVFPPGDRVYRYPLHASSAYSIVQLFRRTLVHSLASIGTFPWNARGEDDWQKDRGLFFWGNDGCLGVDDAEAIANLSDAQYCFRQPGRFPSGERTHRRPL